MWGSRERVGRGEMKLWGSFPQVSQSVTWKGLETWSERVARGLVRGWGRWVEREIASCPPRPRISRTAMLG